MVWSSQLPGSGVWWIRWTDHKGKRHYEKAGRRSDAVALLAKRQTEKLQRKKLPERLSGQYGDSLTQRLRRQESEATLGTATGIVSPHVW